MQASIRTGLFGANARIATHLEFCEPVLGPRFAPGQQGPQHCE
jgi:hypothetical protein